MVSCILLSAGLSFRFGSPKALADLKGRTVIESLLDKLVHSSIDETIVVLGACADEIKPYILKHKKVQFVYNKDYKFGQTSSFKTGLGQISTPSRGVMLLPVDYPFIKTETLDELVRMFNKKSPLALVPTFDGRKGHPPVFSIRLKDEFLSLDSTKGVNTVFHAHEKEVEYTAVGDKGVLATFNTQEELSQIHKEFS